MGKENSNLPPRCFAQLPDVGRCMPKDLPADRGSDLETACRAQGIGSCLNKRMKSINIGRNPTSWAKDDKIPQVTARIARQVLRSNCIINRMQNMATNQSQHIHLRSQNPSHSTWCMEVHSQTFFACEHGYLNLLLLLTQIPLNFHHHRNPPNSSFDVSSRVYIALGLSYLDLGRSNLCIYDTSLKMQHLNKPQFLNFCFFLDMADWK